MGKYKQKQYTISALYRKKKNGSYLYEWKEMRSEGTKKAAEDYAKRESKLSYKDGRTGRYMIRKVEFVSMIEDGKVEK